MADILKVFYNPALAGVIDTQEVMKMFKKSRNTVLMAAYRNEVDCRKTLGGGTILFDYASCVRKWGEPAVNEVRFMLEDGE